MYYRNTVKGKTFTERRSTDKWGVWIMVL